MRQKMKISQRQPKKKKKKFNKVLDFIVEKPHGKYSVRLLFF